MVVVTNMAQLKRALQKEMRKAMQVTAKKVEADMFEETYDFYTQGAPKKYVRTGALGSTPRTTSISQNGNHVEFVAYLDQSHDYTTGTWSMSQVMDAAEKGAAGSGILGKPGFWSRSEKKIQNTMDSVFRSFFH